jgi:hypothetical protein
VLVIGFAGTGWLMWLASPSGTPTRQVNATVLSIAPGVQAKGDQEPIQAVIALRTDDGASITVKRPIECMPAIRPGDHVAVQGAPTNLGVTNWRLVSDRCLR